jgi:hypothetical protein
MKRIKWAKRIVHMGKIEMRRGYFVRTLKEADSLEDLWLNGRMIVKLIVKN